MFIKAVAFFYVLVAITAVHANRPFLPNSLILTEFLNPLMVPSTKHMITYAAFQHILLIHFVGQRDSFLVLPKHK